MTTARVAAAVISAALLVALTAAGLGTSAITWAVAALMVALLAAQAVRTWGQRAELVREREQSGYAPISVLDALSQPKAIGVLALILVPLVVVGVAFGRLSLGVPHQNVDGCAFGQVNKGVVTCISEAVYDQAVAAQFTIIPALLCLGVVVLAAIQVGLRISGDQATRPTAVLK